MLVRHGHSTGVSSLALLAGLAADQSEDLVNHIVGNICELFLRAVLNRMRNENDGRSEPERA